MHDGPTSIPNNTYLDRTVDFPRILGFDLYLVVPELTWWSETSWSNCALFHHKKRRPVVPAACSHVASRELRQNHNSYIHEMAYDTMSEVAESTKERK